MSDFEGKVTDKLSVTGRGTGRIKEEHRAQRKEKDTETALFHSAINGGS